MSPDLLRIEQEYSELPSDPSECHEILVDCFGQFLFWLRNWSLESSRKLVESEDARQRLGKLRQRCFEGVAKMTPEQREAAMLLVEETLNGFGERLIWCLGGKSIDLKFGSKHACRFQVDIEIIEVETEQTVKKETVSVGGKKFFGSYWGRWLNRYSALTPGHTNATPDETKGV